MAYKSKEIAKLAKRANMRMLRMERADIFSPAYKSAQARLEALGTRRNTAAGRRFKETESFANKNEAAQYEKVLRDFLEQKTGTITGYKKYRKSVLEGAHRRYDFEELGISDEEYLEIWENVPDDMMSRIYGSDETVEIVSRRLKKQRDYKDEDKMSIAEIVDKIQSSRTVKDAYNSLGLSYRDMSGSLGEL